MAPSQVGSRVSYISMNVTTVTDVIPTTANLSLANSTSTSLPLSEHTLDIWVVVLEFILGTVGIVGNFLVCVIIWRAKFLHNFTNYLILSLAFADLVASVCIVGNVFVLEAVLFTWTPSNRVAAELYCRFYSNRFLFWTCVTASVFNLVCVTFERFFAIVYPLHYPLYFTSKKVGLMIAGTWIIALVQELFAFFVNYYDTTKQECGYHYTSEAAAIFVGVLVFLLSYFLPLLVMVWAYYRIMSNLKRGAHNSQASGGNNNRGDPAILRARRKVVYVLFTVVIAFVVLWSPNQIVYLFENFGVVIVSTDHVLYKLFRLMAFSNSVINPIIYAFKYKQFRKGFRVAIMCLCTSNHIHDNQAATTELSNS
ncbi:trace amine-associated receptor 6-like [Diadema antillarum]|uniref:trace amine-associated receptor 6-like n=1 Tax=Diadema antillarum TaxID=105358 RepID=UPI003A88BC7B